MAVDEWVRRQQVEYPDLSRLGFGIGRDYYHQRFEHYEEVRGMRKQYFIGGLFVLGVFSCDYFIELFINGQVSARKSALRASLCLSSALTTLFALPLVLPAAVTQRLARAGGNARGAKGRQRGSVTGIPAEFQSVFTPRVSGAAYGALRRCQCVSAGARRRQRPSRRWHPVTKAAVATLATVRSALCNKQATSGALTNSQAPRSLAPGLLFGL